MGYRIEKLSMFEGEYGATADYPYWWNWYGWPQWWNYCNGIGRIAWKVNLAPNQEVNLGYQWHCFWR